jgi:Ner family transcriptional regulator
MTDRYPRDPRIRNERLKCDMRVAKFSFASIARDLKLHRGTPQEVLRRSYPRMEKIIADRLGTTPEAIWPERYSDTGRHDGSVDEAASHDNRRSSRKVLRSRSITKASKGKRKVAQRHGART